MDENQIAKVVINAAFIIHKEHGPGLFESVYENVLEQELKYQYGLNVVCQPVLPVYWWDCRLNIGFRPDMIVENKLIIELRSIESVVPVHYKQLLTYLKLSKIKLGLLINFNNELIKNGIKRIVNGL